MKVKRLRRFAIVVAGFAGFLIAAFAVNQQLEDKVKNTFHRSLIQQGTNAVLGVLITIYVHVFLED